MKHLSHTKLSKKRTDSTIVTKEISSNVISVAISFAEFAVTECRAMPDGWHYKGVAYSSIELFKLWYKERNG